MISFKPRPLYLVPVGGQAGLRAGLDFILPGMEPRLLGRPARSPPLYRLNYGAEEDKGIYRDWARNLKGTDHVGDVIGSETRTDLREAGHEDVAWICLALN